MTDVAISRRADGISEVTIFLETKEDIRAFYNANYKVLENTLWLKTVLDQDKFTILHLLPNGWLLRVIETKITESKEERKEGS